MKLGGFPAVCVEWLDARTVYEQLELDEVATKVTLSHRFTFGLLVHKDRERIILAGTFDPAEKKVDRAQTPDSDGGADFTTIPRTWATKITMLGALDTKAEEDGQPET